MLAKIACGEDVGEQILVFVGLVTVGLYGVCVKCVGLAVSSIQEAVSVRTVTEKFPLAEVDAGSFGIGASFAEVNGKYDGEFVGDVVVFFAKEDFKSTFGKSDGVAAVSTGFYLI